MYTLNPIQKGLYNMKERIKVGYIGLGRRGMRMLTAYLSKMPDVDILAVCDLCEDKMEAAKKSLMEDGRPAPKITADYHDILSDPEIEAVLIMTGWNDRPKMAKEAMLAHKYTAIEVGCLRNALSFLTSTRKRELL